MAEVSGTVHTPAAFKHEQRDNMGHRSARDQHGRKWSFAYGKGTMHPIGPIQAQFKAPVLPHQKYIKMDRTDDGAIVIDYDEWENDIRTAQQNFDAYLLSIAQHMNPNNWADEIKSPSAAVRRLVGKAPQSIEIPRACKAGNKWMLGLSDVRPAWVDEKNLFPVAVQDSVTEYPDAEPSDEELERLTNPDPVGVN